MLDHQGSRKSKGSKTIWFGRDDLEAELSQVGLRVKQVWFCEGVEMITQLNPGLYAWFSLVRHTSQSVRIYSAMRIFCLY